MRRHHPRGIPRNRRGSFKQNDTVGFVVINDEFVLATLFGLLGRFLWRYRSEAAPIAVALTAFIACAIGHINHRAAWLPVAGLSIGLSTLMATPYVLLRRQRLTSFWGVGLSRIWQAFGMDRPIEWLYGSFVVAILGSWCATALAFGPTTRPLPTIWFVGTLLCGIPWWIHRRRRARVRVARVTSAWPSLAESMGLPGSRIASAVVDAWGWTGRLILRKGGTVTDAVNRIPSIESGLGVRSGSVRILPDGKRADRCIVRVVEKDPHAEPIIWPAPTRASITKPIILGLFEDAAEVSVSILRRHVLIGGVIGSGKSGVVNVILGTLAACRDAVVWGIDMKEGMELSPWKPCLTRLATNAEESRILLQAAVAELERRARILTGRGLRVWEPTPKDPALVIVIDEYAELPEDSREFADSIARRGRAVAVTLVAATQRPTQKTMGGATRSQMDIRICLRVRERRDTDLILGQGYSRSGWNAEALTAAGSFLISSPEHQVAHRARAYLVTDQAVSRQVGQVSPLLKDSRPSDPVPTMLALPGKASTAEPAEGSNSRGGEESNSPPDPEEAFWNALLRSGPQGLSIRTLMAACGMGRTWVYDRLQEHAAAGRVHQVARGRWRATGGEAEPTERPA